MKKLFQLLTNRAIIIALLILIQIAALAGMIWRFNNYFVYFYAFCSVLGLLLVLYIINGHDNPAYKIAWLIPIMLMPIFGSLLYLLFGKIKINKKNRFLIAESKKNGMAALQSYSVLNNIEENKTAYNQSHYIENYSDSPLFNNTYTKYLPMGEIFFEHLKEELEKAEHYIFMEYFIIQEGVMWNSILDILIRKAKQGVDVRLMYDDIGCMFTLPNRYYKKMESLGIKCCVFNPFIPVLSSLFNNRSHRKITVIDGIVGFTGGINLADEYINVIEKYGRWKDSSILIKGNAVWGLTVFFLSVWNYLRKENTSYEKFQPKASIYNFEGKGYVQPYSSGPLHGETVAENVYMNIINKAEQYVYITSPYLIIDNEMVKALSMAAKSGVDVRIITPHIPDKWYIHAVTRNYYEQLLESNVRIYEYTPGFIHTKSIVADDKYASTGTVNLDYRSFYLHFECGVWLYNTDSVLQIKNDFLKTVEVSCEVSLEKCRNISFIRKLGRSILSAFAPLM